MALILALLLQDGTLGQSVEAWMKRQEIPAVAAAPEWSKDLGEPLFTFAVLSDIHWRAGQDFDALDRACRFVDERKAAFLLVLGDNVSASKDAMKASHETLKKRFDEKLKTPLKIVKGDNDARDYESVFGPSDYAFSYGGVRFVGFGLTRDFEGVGVGWYGNAGWVARDVVAHLREPVVLFTHIPPWPPTAAGSPVIAAGAAVAPNVAGVLSGHIHYDLESAIGGKPVMMTGAFLFAGRPVKLAEVHAKRIVIKTYERRGDDYVFADKWQKIDFPEGYELEPGAPAKFRDEVSHKGGETRFFSPAAAGAVAAAYRTLRTVRPFKVLDVARRLLESFAHP